MGVRCTGTRSPLDRLLGMDCYLTDSEPAIPLSILRPDNFYVYEYLDGIGVVRPPIPFFGMTGDLYTYLLIKRGIDTYNAIHRIRRILRARRISYYGLKDAKATTYQLIVVEKPDKLESYICDKDLIEAVLLGMAGSHARRGDNIGNCFKILLGSVVEDVEVPKILTAVDYVQRVGFIPNYYSYQRFGVKRPITHVAGMGLICGSYQGALEAIVTGDPNSDSGRDLGEICREIIAKGPRWMNIERIVCRSYIESRDPFKAVKRLPKVYLELYISASLSYIFNLYLSLRWRDRGLGLDAVEGEEILRSPLYGSKIPGVRVTTDVDDKLGYVVLEALRRYGLENCKPRIIRSSVRPLVLPIALRIASYSLEFCLDGGGYATNLLREVFKEYTPSLFSPDLNLGSRYH